MPDYRLNLKRFTLILFAMLLLPMLWGCNKDTYLGRFYHNTTARFNGYFNAQVKYDESLKDIRSNHRDDFSNVLPVFVYGTASASANFYPQFDEVIKKCSNVIQDHDISKWVDNCFLLIGQAYFMKREYFEAIESFQYVYTKWKKEPISDEALLWLIRAYIASGQYAKAQGGIDLIINNRNFPEDKKGYMHALRAELYIAQKRYDQAIEPILQVKKYKWGKQQRARFHFILGQLYAINSPRQAGEQFRNSLKKKPYYEMQFQARMNIARLYDGKSVTAKQAKKQLKRLLKEEKNKDYFDEIYYELAMLAFKDRNTPLGIAYLKQSTAASTKNQRQKAKSYLYLAEFYFKQREFRESQLYYDSTAGVIAKEHPKYREVQGKKSYLSDLVRNYQVIEEQDSLLKLASMPESQLNRIIDKAIKEERKRKDQERFEKESGNQMNNMNNPGMGQQAPGVDGRGGSGDWYFYNQQLSGTGYSQFLQRWGNRELADDWRRSRKEKRVVEDNGQDNGGDGQKIDLDELIDDSNPRAKYLARIPLSEAAKKKAITQIQTALFNLGGIYREKLDDYPKSIEHYEKLLKIYPGYEKEDEALYRTGLVFELMGNEERKSFYLQRLVGEYPASAFARLITNPETLEDKDEKALDEAIEKLYTQTYSQFQLGKYQHVALAAQEANLKFKGHQLIPNFDFLSAMCLGRSADTAQMKSALSSLVARFPNHAVSELATEILNMLDPQKRAEMTGAIEKELFRKKPEEPHFMILAIDLRVFSQHREIQLKLANFNDTNFRNARLRVTNMLYGQQYQLLVVRELPDERKAMEFLQVARQNDELLKDLPIGKYHTFIAAKENFNELYKNNQMREYLTFFEKQYK